MQIELIKMDDKHIQRRCRTIRQLACFNALFSLREIYDFSYFLERDTLERCKDVNGAVHDETHVCVCAMFDVSSPKLIPREKQVLSWNTCASNRKAIAEH